MRAAATALTRRNENVPMFTTVIGAISTPASPDSAPPRAQLNRETLDGRSPMSRDTSGSWPAARTPRPNHVRRSTSAKPTARRIETTNIDARW